MTCPRPTDALGRWLESYLFRQMQRRRAVSARVLWGWRLCVVIEAVVREGQQAADRLDLWALHHARAILSQPTDVWQINRRGWGWCHVEAWRQRLAPDAQPRAPALSWVWPARIALACLLVCAAWVEPVHAGVSFAALSATTIWENESGGVDTNGAAFDPGQTAGMFTDGAATSANTASPVFTSASYNFVAGDVEAWMFVASGTNWTPGWYKIVSVAANAATLSAAIGAAVGSTGATTSPVIPSTIIGCATVASPTAATWSIDYSQQLAAQFTYTDLASAGTGLTCSSVLLPFGKQQVGNALNIDAVGNFNAGIYVIASVSAGLVATVVGPTNITTGVGLAGTGRQGGAFASPGIAGATMRTSNQLFVKTGTYTVTSATINIAAGCLAPTTTSLVIEGYGAVRGDLQAPGASGTRPTMIASGISTFTLISPSGGTANSVRNLILDGASLTSSRGVDTNGVQNYNVHAQNCTNGGFGATNMSTFRCSTTGCATVAASANTNFNAFSVAYSNTVTAFLGTNFIYCIASNNSGASSDGFQQTSTASATCTNSVSYANGRDGFRFQNSTQMLVNVIAESNTGVGYTLSGGSGVGIIFLRGAGYLNTGGNLVSPTGAHLMNSGFITGTASFFTNAAGGDFSLNTTAGGGALLRAAGYPGVFPVGLTTGYLDIGAAQHRDDISIAVSNVAIFQARQSVGY